MRFYKAGNGDADRHGTLSLHWWRLHSEWDVSLWTPRNVYGIEHRIVHKENQNVIPVNQRVRWNEPSDGEAGTV